MSEVLMILFSIGNTFIVTLFALGLKEKNKWRFAKDKINTKDKLVHFLGGIFIGTLFGHYATTLNVMWELKDAVFPYEKHGKLGGDGFSWKDLLCSQAGIIIGAWFRNYLV